MIKKLWEMFLGLFRKKPADVIVLVPPPVEAPKKREVRGVDCAKWQTGIRWKDVQAAGFEFAICKASDGATSKDVAYNEHRRGAKAAGLIFGSYHFFRFDIDPLIQAENFLKTMGDVQPGELPPCLDLEWDRYSKNQTEGKTMDEVAAKNALICLERIEKVTGMVPIVYTNYYFFQGFKNPERFAKYTPWIPAYNTTADKVRIPPPWKKLVFWQYSESLTLGGVDKVDGNIFFGTIDELKALVKK